MSAQNEVFRMSMSETNSSSVSAIDMVLTDEELLRLVRAQARRRGARASRHHALARSNDRHLARALTELFELRRRRDELQRLLDAKEEELVAIRASQEAQEAPQGHICSVCLQFEVDRAMVPCGHAALCSHCVRRLEAQAAPFGIFKCPICRTFVQKTIKLHFA